MSEESLEFTGNNFDTVNSWVKGVDSYKSSTVTDADGNQVLVVSHGDVSVKVPPGSTLTRDVDGQTVQINSDNAQPQGEDDE